MLQNFCTKNCVKLIVGKLQASDIALHRLNSRMKNRRFLQIKGYNLLEPTGKFFCKVAIPCTNVEDLNAAARKKR